MEKLTPPVVHSPIKEWDAEQTRRNELAQGKLVFKHDEMIPLLVKKIDALEKAVEALQAVKPAKIKAE